MIRYRKFGVGDRFILRLDDINRGLMVYKRKYELRYSGDDCRKIILYNNIDYSTWREVNIDDDTVKAIVSENREAEDSITNNISKYLSRESINKLFYINTLSLRFSSMGSMVYKYKWYVYNSKTRKYVKFIIKDGV
jgi:hypothetical protein